MNQLYAVIGQHDSDPDRLLVLGEDGQHYAWELTNDETVPIEPGDEWTLDDDLPDREVLFGDEAAP